MLQAGFEPSIPASERPKTHALDCAATGIGRIATLWLVCTRVTETSEGLYTFSYIVTDSSTMHGCCFLEVQEHSLTNANSAIAGFLQNYSHELSTQLTGFMAFACPKCHISLPTTDTQKFYMRKREEKDEYTKKESEKLAKKCRAT